MRRKSESGRVLAFFASVDPAEGAAVLDSARQILDARRPAPVRVKRGRKVTRPEAVPDVKSA